MYYYSRLSILFRGLLCTSLLTSLALPLHAQRDTVDIVDWQFSRASLTPSQANAGDAKWQTVRLPHDFQISQPWVAPTANERADNSDQAANVKSRLSARGFKEMGTGWYRRSFTPDIQWRGRRVMLEVGGIMLVGDVYLNGERIGGTEYGYVGFGIDVTDKLRYGQENVLTVKADTREANNSRWYTGGGLFRDVKLIVTDRNLHFDRHPLQITTTDNRTIHIRAAITRENRQRATALTVCIRDAQGRVVAARDTLLKLSPRRHTMEYPLSAITLKQPHVWDLDTPYLYSAELTLRDDSGRVCDRVSESFGIRTIEYGPSFGFKLNGRKVILKGIANHHTLGALGAAAYPRAIEKRIQLLKEFGFNHIRCSHNPYSEDLYRLCDKYGILVVDELYDKWLTQYAGGRQPWSSHWQYDVPEWVQRDRNHPSVIMWSLGNELQTYPNLPFNDWGVTPYRLLRTLLHRYDTTRPVTVAMHPRGRNWQTDSLPCDLAMITDIQAYNYRYMYFPDDGRRFPNMIFYQSEANLPMMGPNYFGMDLDRVVGLAYWGMIDYNGESLGWPRKGWDNGVFDRSLLPKPQAYLLKAMFTDKPTVHIGVAGGKDEATTWNGVTFGGDKITWHWNRTPGKRYTVYTYTNADEVELFLNGKSLGRKRNSMDPNTRDKIRWDSIAYEPGTLLAVARIAGKEVARHEVVTAGEAKRLVLTPDKETWKADGQDLMHIRVLAVDAKGHRTPLANDTLTIHVSGPAELVAVDNGDITSNESFVSPTTCLYQGNLLLVLRAGKQAGKVRVVLKDQTGRTRGKCTFLPKPGQSSGSNSTFCS